MKKKKNKKIKPIDNKIYITTAIDLEDTYVQRVKKIFGQDEVKLVVDRNIIGGIRIKHKGDFFDGTIKSHLQELKNTLNKS